jgi:hypothetical protein
MTMQARYSCGTLSDVLRSLKEDLLLEQKLRREAE